ncbi:MAG TPA: bifunctional phosphopantothenoylcysteine decarboxylase/phosphopantothenate--cysteine ligase CoaBC [Actinomycetales bacterium]|nr:bifunctional phosphopantothenoylcysteine decarboxylase/phosphopantothenate--cysteine ligase CoaBC [Actinomycetales bacterium]
MSAAGGAPRNVVLGVSGGIAAYKAASLLRLLTEAGHRVRVVPTEAALRFVGAPTWEALSGRPVATSVWDDVHEVPHVRLGQEADVVVVAPATADLLARAAHGQADDLLTSILLTARCPVVMAPAMHTEMWLHPATAANVATLRGRGVVVLDPADGRLTGADTGAGRLPEPEVLAQVALRVLERGPADPDLAGRHVVVSAGGTREPLDPVRYLGNRSSGRQGFALAMTAAARGARVTLVAANSELPTPAGVRRVDVGTARELRVAVREAAAGADVVVMAAAVADFRPTAESSSKIKKTDDPDEAPTIELVRNPDILAELAAVRLRAEQVVVGFAAETGDADGDVLTHARAKLERKGCDLLVVNEVGAGKGFGTADNSVVVLDAAGGEKVVGPASKADVADAVWDAVATRLQ